MKHNELTKTDQRKIQLSATVIAAFVVFAIAMMGFVRIASEIRESDTTAFDTAILKFIHRFESPFLDSFVPIATNLGGIIVVFLLTLITLALFILKREYRRAAMVAVSMGGAVILNVVLKSVFERARPDLWDRLVNEASYSFPSGHSMMTAALGLTLIVVLWNSRFRWWTVGASILYILFVGSTRLYLGVHYPTDVVGGWLVSAAWVAASALLLQTPLAKQALKVKK
jgi:undecaprenyl-diphosphatase